MDRTVKLLLAIIAFSLVSLNLQLAGVSLVSEAKAELNGLDLMGISLSIDSIAGGIDSVATNLGDLKNTIRRACS